MKTIHLLFLPFSLRSIKCYVQSRLSHLLATHTRIFYLSLSLCVAYAHTFFFLPCPSFSLFLSLSLFLSFSLLPLYVRRSDPVTPLTLRSGATNTTTCQAWTHGRRKKYQIIRMRKCARESAEVASGRNQFCALIQTMSPIVPLPLPLSLFLSLYLGETITDFSRLRTPSR